MKKYILCLLLFVLMSMNLCASGESVSEWNYELREDDTAIITAYLGTDSEVTIPEMLDGHLVTALACNVFWFNEEITSVNIPESLTSIGDYVFLADYERNISAYYDNMLGPELAKVLVDYFAEYADVDQINPFLGCFSLEIINVSPENPVFTVTGNMLINKVSNTAIVYPAGRQDADYAIPEGITSIGFQTFFGSNFTSVSLPASLSEIRQNPFIFCLNLKDITVSGNNENFSVRNNALLSSGGMLVSYPMTADKESYTVPDGIEAIGAGAFFNNMSLKEVVLPEGVKTIEGRAFDHCENLKTVILPEGLLSIEDDAFKNCYALAEINLPGTVTWIDERAFFNIGRDLVFVVEKNTYGALWTMAQQYRFRFSGKPEEKSLLTQAVDSLKDENGNISKYHLNYRAEYERTGIWFTRDIYEIDDMTYTIDEDEANGVKVTMYKDGILYTLFPDSKTGKAKEVDKYYARDDIYQETKRLYARIIDHANRTDYVSVTRSLGNRGYSAEVFSENRYGPEIAFYFDIREDYHFAYVHDEYYYGLGPTIINYGDGELLFTIYDFSNDFDESVFDISDYEITQQ